MRNKIALFGILAFIICSVSVAFVVTPVSAQRLIWSFETGGEVGNVAAIDDVNGDNIPDVLAGSRDGKVYCIDGERGILIWTYDTGAQNLDEAVRVLNIGDVNNNGFSDAVVVTRTYPSSGCYVVCVDGDTGTQIWETEINKPMTWAVATIVDFTQDGFQDVVVGTGTGMPIGSFIHWLDGSNGNVMNSQFISDYHVEAIASIDDVDNGGKPDVLLGGTVRHDFGSYGWWHQAIVDCYRGEDYWIYWHWDGPWNIQYSDWSSYMRSIATISSVNADIIPDVLIGYAGTGDIQHRVVCVDGTNGRGEIWSRPIDHPVTLEKGIASIGDVNNDGVSDALAGTGPRVYCFEGIWSFDTHGSESIVDSVDDVNYDGIPDAIVGTSYPSPPKGVVRCIEGDSPPSALPLWTYKIENGHVLDLTSIDDISSPPDGIPDVLVGASDNKVYALSGIGASPGVDVFIRDCPWDDGSVPSSAVCENGWIHLSPDIWVTDTAGNVIPNPVVNEVNLLYARVFNIGTETAYNTEVNFYWADFGGGWPPTLWHHLPPLITIPSLPRGSNIIAWPVEWEPKSWEGTKHRCIFVKLTNAGDPDGSGWDSNWDNNIGWRNFAVEGLKRTIIDGLVFYIATVPLKFGNPDNISARDVFWDLFLEDLPYNWTVELTSSDSRFGPVPDRWNKYVFSSMEPGEVVDVTLKVIALEGFENDTGIITITGTIDNRPIGGISAKIVPPIRNIITETEYQNSITQPIDISKIRFVQNAVNEKWVKGSKWPIPMELMYWQKSTKYLIEIDVEGNGNVTRVGFRRWGSPITEIPYKLAEQSLASLPPGFAIGP